MTSPPAKRELALCSLSHQRGELKRDSIPVGLFENCEGITFEEQLFIDKKPEYYSFSNETKTMTEAEVWATYSPFEES